MQIITTKKQNLKLKARFLINHLILETIVNPSNKFLNNHKKKRNQNLFQVLNK